MFFSDLGFFESSNQKINKGFYHGFVKIMGVCFSYLTSFSVNVFEGLVVPYEQVSEEREELGWRREGMMLNVTTGGKRT